jgi:PPOX class probable F420-dependent enzyme
MRSSSKIPSTIQAKVGAARVARFATLDAQGRPHILPVCFFFDGSTFYTAIDRKPKRVAPENLARVRQIRARAEVALLIDEYSEEWTRLWWVLVRGKAKAMPGSRASACAKVIRALKKKYPQYASGMLSDDALIIRIIPKRVAYWVASPGADTPDRSRTNLRSTSAGEQQVS